MITYEQLRGRCQNVHDYAKYFACECPYDQHQTPALLVYQDGWFRCLSCGVTGTYDRLWRKLSGQEVVISVPERMMWHPPAAAKTIGEQESFCMSAYECLTANIDTLGWYLRMRGVLGRVDSCRLGWNAGWYTIPVYSREHTFEGYVMRASIAIQHATGRRFNMPRGMGGKMYVPDWHMLESAPFILVVYGIFDALALSELRLPVCTDTSGKKGFRPEWLDAYRKPVYIIPDKGEELDGRKLANELGWRGKPILLDYPDGIKDPAQFVEVGKSKDLLSQLYKITGDF